jgi:hypothetical protein
MKRSLIKNSRSISLEEAKPYVPTIKDSTTDADVIDLLRNADTMPEDSRVGSDKIHVSSLMNHFCPRREWLKRNVGYVAPKSASAATRLVWALGRAAESHVRSQLLSSMLGNAFGIWSCTRCDARESEARLHEFKRCECGGTFDRYGETVVEDEELGLIGSVDFVWVHRDFFNVVEIKSMNAREFDLLKKAKADHMNQVEMYRWLLHRSGKKVFRAEVVVVAKDFVKGSPYQKFESKIVATARPQIFKVVKDDVALARGKEKPKRLAACHDASTSVARACEACSACFSVSD